MLYSDINNINNIEYSEQNISRMDKWYINDQRKQTQHNIILVFNNSNKSRFALHILGVTKIKTADNSSVLSTCSNVWFLLLIYQSFYPLQFVASFKQVA